MQMPQIRPGKVSGVRESVPTLVVFFRNSAQANAAIQLVIQLGVPSEGLGVTTSEELPGHQGMLLTIPCPNEPLRDLVEKICKAQGAVVHGQRNVN
jgi:hypothetical protein